MKKRFNIILLMEGESLARGDSPRIFWIVAGAGMSSNLATRGDELTYDEITHLAFRSKTVYAVIDLITIIFSRRRYA